jgi:hypothetical protein
LGDFVAVAGGQEGAEGVVVGSLAGALGEAGPPASEGLGGEGVDLVLVALAVGDGDEEVEGGLVVDVVDELGGVVLGVGDDGRVAVGGSEDLGRQAQQAGAGLVLLSTSWKFFSEKKNGISLTAPAPLSGMLAVKDGRGQRSKQVLSRVGRPCGPSCPFPVP